MLFNQIFNHAKTFSPFKSVMQRHNASPVNRIRTLPTSTTTSTTTITIAALFVDVTHSLLLYYFLSTSHYFYSRIYHLSRLYIIEFFSTYTLLYYYRIISVKIKTNTHPLFALFYDFHQHFSTFAKSTTFIIFIVCHLVYSHSTIKRFYYHQIFSNFTFL